MGSYERSRRPVSNWVDKLHTDVSSVVFNPGLNAFELSDRASVGESPVLIQLVDVVARILSRVRPGEPVVLEEVGSRIAVVVQNDGVLGFVPTRDNGLVVKNRERTATIHFIVEEERLCVIRL